MKNSKKVYVLMVSKVFPAYHPKCGQPTHFMEKILLPFDRVMVEEEDGNRFTSKEGYGSKFAAQIISQWTEPKRHTIRENYDLWAYRAQEINAGRAVLSLRQWTGSPYNFKRDGSKQKEFLQLTKIGVQKVDIDIITHDFGTGFSECIRPAVMRLKFPEIQQIASTPIAPHIEVPQKHLDLFYQIAHNDGLNTADFISWFKKPSDQPYACIQFTDFKY